MWSVPSKFTSDDFACVLPWNIIMINDNHNDHDDHNECNLNNIRGVSNNKPT